MTGLHLRVPFDKYAAIDAINFSRLKEMRRSPKHYRHRLTNPLQSQPLTLGAAAHTAVLEPHRFLAEYALWDERTDSGSVRPRRGKAWEAFEAGHAGRRIVKADEYYMAMAMRDAVRGDPDAARYLSKGYPEASMVWADKETDRVCKGRVDWLTNVDGCDVLVGLKTARDCRGLPFGNAAGRLGYHLQWGFYFDGYVAVTGRLPKMIEIVVESFAPHDVAVYIIPAEVVEVGRDEYRRLLLALGECERTNRWPGAMPGEQVLSLPSYIYGEEDISEIGLEVA
jgi:hypothetical protein